MMTQKEREEFIQNHEKDWETFTIKQRENWVGMYNTLNAEIPKSAEEMRKEIAEKIEKFNKNNI